MNGHAGENEGIHVLPEFVTTLIPLPDLSTPREYARSACEGADVLVEFCDVALPLQPEAEAEQ
jgi:hypothetical protein